MEDQVKLLFLVLLFPFFLNFFLQGSGKSATIKAISLHAEKILRQAGDNPLFPVVLIAAPTGKAASLIGKKE